MTLSTVRKRKITRKTNEKLEEVVREPTVPVPVTTLGAILELLFTDLEEYEYALRAYEKFVDEARAGDGDFKSKGKDSAECISVVQPPDVAFEATAAPTDNKSKVIGAMLEVMSQDRCDTMLVIVRNAQEELEGEVAANSVARWVLFLLKPTRPPFKDCGNGTYCLL